MTSKTLLLSAAVVATALLSGGATTAFAQAAPPQQGQQDQAGGPDKGSSNDAMQGETPRQSAILAVTGIEVMRSSHGGKGEIVRVTGVTSSNGWSSPALVPLMAGKPSDGILDLVFQAETPGGVLEADGFAPIEAILLIDADHPYKGIRVRSATNAVTLKTLPGYVESPAPADPCNKCVGKLFVAKGATAPAGAASGDAVREQDLPPTTRIVKPTDGITELPWNPNRLTLVIGDDGRITDAAWD